MPKRRPQIIRKRSALQDGKVKRACAYKVDILTKKTTKLHSDGRRG